MNANLFAYIYHLMFAIAPKRIFFHMRILSFTMMFETGATTNPVAFHYDKSPSTDQSAKDRYCQAVIHWQEVVLLPGTPAYHFNSPVRILPPSFEVQYRRRAT